jgi:flagellar hook-length control protein FliK
MVPFSFENITRSAALDTLKVLPVSESARATHQSFETHLQQATAPPPSPSTHERMREDRPPERPTSSSTNAPRNEPARPTTNETRRNDEEDRDDQSAAAISSKPEPAHDDEDVGKDTVAGDEVVVAAVATVEEQRANVQDLELQASADLNNKTDDEAAIKPTNAALDKEAAKVDATLKTEGESTEEQAAVETDGDPANHRQVKGGSGESQESDPSAPPNGSDRKTETNEKVAASDARETGIVSETEAQDDVAPKTAKPQRRDNRNDITVNQQKVETVETNADAAAQSVDAALVDAAADTASDSNSRESRDHNNTEGSQPIGKATAADETAKTQGTPSRFAQHLLAKTGEPSARGANLSDADQARFVDRVARAVQATGDRGGTLRLRLSPPELGSLTLEIKVQSGAVTARVEADTPAARTLLLENLPLLRERLAEHGMRVDQFDVDLTDRHTGGTPDGLQQNDRQQEDRPRSQSHSRELEETPRSSSQEANTTIGNGQLNIIV